MRLIFASKESYLPDVVGGGGLDIHHMTLALQSRGHQVSVIGARARDRRHLAGRVRQKLAGDRVVATRDTGNGYVTARALYWRVAALLDEEVARERPDAVIVLCTQSEELALVAAERGVPVLIRLVTAECPERLAQAAEADERVAKLLVNPLVKVVSNSNYVAGLAQELLGVSAEIDYPMIKLAESVAAERTADCITFVNPRSIKGLDIALAVAGLLPHRRFVFAESFVLSDTERKALDAELARLTNVRFRPYSANLKELYAQTSVLMVPSRLREAFGRVIIEACANGIPVVARSIGGIPEAMGSSGVLLSESDPPERWAAAIEEILAKPERYAELSERARANAAREEFDETQITTRFLGMVQDHISVASR
jgi:glycosyltransferase involved in cell wall biosynthesis